MHGYSSYYLTIKLQTSAWLACNVFVTNYFLVRPLSDVQKRNKNIGQLNQVLINRENVFFLQY